jgi:exo-beta-1,3-glucanase (GH17 family)
MSHAPLLDRHQLNGSQQLEAIKQTKVDMTIYLGNYAVPDDNNTAYNRQRDVIQTTLQTYGTDHISGITVGNEYMLKYDHLLSHMRTVLTNLCLCSYLTDHQSSDPNSAVGNQGESYSVEAEKAPFAQFLLV